MDDRSRRRPAVEVSWQSSAKYCGDKPFIALYTKTASLNSMRCHTAGNQWSRRAWCADDVGTSNKTCCSILYGLKTPEQIVRDAEQQWVTVVKTRRDECMNHFVVGIDKSRTRPADTLVWQIGAAKSIHTPTWTQRWHYTDMVRWRVSVHISWWNRSGEFIVDHRVKSTRSRFHGTSCTDAHSRWTCGLTVCLEQRVELVAVAGVVSLILGHNRTRWLKGKIVSEITNYYVSRLEQSQTHSLLLSIISMHSWQETISKTSFRQC